MIYIVQNDAHNNYKNQPNYSLDYFTWKKFILDSYNECSHFIFI